MSDWWVVSTAFFPFITMRLCSFSAHPFAIPAYPTFSLIKVYSNFSHQCPQRTGCTPFLAYPYDTTVFLEQIPKHATKALGRQKPQTTEPRTTISYSQNCPHSVRTLELNCQLCESLSTTRRIHRRRGSCVMLHYHAPLLHKGCDILSNNDLGNLYSNGLVFWDYWIYLGP